MSLGEYMGLSRGGGLDAHAGSAYAEHVAAWTAGGLTLSVSNEYSAYSSTSGAAYYGWTVVEPHRSTTLFADGGDDGSSYEWDVNEGGQTIYGNPAVFEFRQLGDTVMTVRELDATTGQSKANLTTSVMVKYVRREIRSMTDRDREAMFSAIMVMQRVPTDVGQALYGEKYYSKDYFTRIHQSYGGSSDCDHWHQGAGFVTSHFAYTLMYEAAMQAVDSSVSMPYWDFTLESTFYTPNDWRNSPVFSNDWFGDASPPNDMHIVTEGRWGFNSVMVNAQNYSTTNPYGMMRSPWNHDSTPFMTRSDKIYGYLNNVKPSGCQQYHTTLQTDNWMHLSHLLNAATHGHIHETIGGAWDNIYPEFLNGTVSPAVYTFAHSIQPLARILWRNDLLECPDSCDMTTDPKDCMCTCSEEKMAGRASYEILDSSGILESVEYFDHDGHLLNSFYNESTGKIEYSLPHYTHEESMDIYDGLLKLCCAPGKIGDQYDSNSPNDVTFWMLHPTMERIWHYMRMAPVVYNETWDPYHTCYGHNPDDLQPFRNLFDDNNEYYSNSDLYSLLHPQNEDLPYIYDNFEWPHCELLGYDMSATYRR